MKQNLKDAVKAHYESKGLTDAQLTSLEQLTAKPKQSRRALLVGIAAAIGLVAGGSFFVRQNSGDIYYRIAAEISKNHGKRLDMEVATDSYTGVYQQLSKLDFTVIAQRE